MFQQKPKVVGVKCLSVDVYFAVHADIVRDDLKPCADVAPQANLCAFARGALDSLQFARSHNDLTPRHRKRSNSAAHNCEKCSNPKRKPNPFPPVLNVGRDVDVRWIQVGWGVFHHGCFIGVTFAHHETQRPSGFAVW